ncbi:MAG: LysR family transcriptional regulator [Pseudobdellovibrionaceae bacterium]
MIHDLHSNFAALVKAVRYKNLSAASEHIGLSQPQLSRLIQRLEQELGVMLLDRTSKRSSGWLTQAHQLAEIYQQSDKRLKLEIESLNQESVPKELRIGTLEGLSEKALSVSHELLKLDSIEFVSLDILDLNELEEQFMAQNLDVLFSLKTPGKQKYTKIVEVGYQKLEWFKKDENIMVQSSFEYGVTKKKSSAKSFVSNSLVLRKTFLDRYSGAGQIPTEVLSKREKGTDPVYMIGQETMTVAAWDRILKAQEKAAK